MRLSILSILINVAIGVAWVIFLSGGFVAFYHSLGLGFFFTISSTLLGIMPGFLFLIVFESANLLIKVRLEQIELKEMLEKIGKNSDKDKILSNN